MTQKHKDMLRENRGEITENMSPDDVLIRLQAKGVLTPKDVSRIKEKGSVDNQNEHLLDILMRKPDRGFSEFLISLTQTEQGHVAELLDPESTEHECEPAASSSTRNLRKAGRHKGFGAGHSTGAANYASDDEYLSSSSSPKKRKGNNLSSL